MSTIPLIHRPSMSKAKSLASMLLLLTMPLVAWSQAGSDGPKTEFAAAVHLGAPQNNPNSPSLRVAPNGRLYAIWVADDPRAATAARADTSGAADEHQHQHHHMHMPGSGSPGHTPGAAAYLSYSTDGGQSWSPPRFVNRKPDNVLGEEEPPRIGFSPDGQLYAVWDVIGSDNYMADDVHFARQQENGEFTPAITVNDIPDVARFGALGVSASGHVLVAWIDRRADTPAPRAIYLSRFDGQGQTLESNVKVGAPSCECCRGTIAFADGGQRVYIAYRENRDNIRDIVVQTSTDGGRHFAPPVVVSNDEWHVEVCPHAGPVIATDAAGHVYVAYFTGKPGMAGVYYAVSTDGGKTFGPHQLINADNGPEPLHAYLAVDDQGTVYVAWDNFPPDELVTRIFFRRIAADSRMSPIQQLSHAAGNASRPSVALSDAHVHIAWTQIQGGHATVVVRTGNR